MGYRDQRFNTILVALIKNSVVKFQSLFIRLFLIASWKNPAPCNRQTEYLETNLCKKPDIFLIAVIEINRHKFHIIFRRYGCPCPFDTVRHHILNGQSLSVLIVSTLTLVCRHSAAPQKIFRKHISHLTLSHYSCVLSIAREFLTTKSVSFLMYAASAQICRLKNL